jgi:hypothetical protein
MWIYVFVVLSSFDCLYYGINILFMFERNELGNNSTFKLETGNIL